MGICCSKKKQQPLSPSPPLAEKEKKNVAVQEAEVEKKKGNGTTTTTITTISRTSTQTQLVEAEKKPVSVIAVTAPTSIDSNSSEEKQEIKVVPVAEPRPAAAVRTSSCTKEEVDAILIQCGRLSRSSSGNTTNEANRGHRRHSGSKRSYDFDNDKSSTSKDEDEDWEEAKPVSRPSPHRRTPGREREHYKRSGSRERGRGGTGSPRVSRSPGRRSDGPGSSDKPRQQQQQQPGKLVSLPAREKGGVKRNAASSRSNSPAKNAVKVGNENALHQPQPQPQPQSLSRSSSRKGEESPFRRNPMAEIDANSLRPNQKAPKSREGGEEAFRKPSPVRSQRTGDKRSGAATSTEVPKGSNNNNNNNNISNYVREQLMSCRANEKLRESELRDARTLTRTRSSRRSSKDFDHLVVGPNSENAPPNPNSYASLLLEDIQNYHQQSAAAAPPFSLPACVSKACSILDAVADLNSSSSDYSNNDNVRLGRGSFSGEPSLLHKHIPETEPQESAGSNSFVVQSPWANSADSTDRRWTPRPDDAEEEVAFDSQGKGSRGGGGSGSSSSLRAAMTPGKKREAYVKSGGNRACSLPVVVAAVTS